MSVKIISAISLVVGTSTAFAEMVPVNNGGQVLEGLIRSCDIVGISNSGEASAVGYYFRGIRPRDLVAVQGNSVTIRNVTAEDFTAYRPRIITLTLNRMELENGAPVRYYISGAYTGASRFQVDSTSTAGRDGGNVLLGTLGEIAFSPTDVLKRDGERATLRGLLTYVNLDLKSDEVTFPRNVFNKSPITFTWDLATPSNINKDVFCRYGE